MELDERRDATNWALMWHLQRQGTNSLFSVNPLLFGSPVDVAVNSQELRRNVSQYLNPRKSIRKGRIFVAMCPALFI